MSIIVRPPVRDLTALVHVVADLRAPVGVMVAVHREHAAAGGAVLPAVVSVVLVELTDLAVVRRDDPVFVYVIAFHVLLSFRLRSPSV